MCAAGHHITVPIESNTGTNTELMRSSRSSTARIARLSMAAFVMAACTTSTDPIPIATITLQPGLDSIELNETFSNWIVTLKDATGATLTGRKLSWESNNTAVATIDPGSGVVTGIGSGQSLITVRAEGKLAQSTIKVLQPVLSIVATPDSFDLPLTTSRSIAVQLVGPGGVALTNRVITWSSSSPNVAVVSTSGVVTSVSIGTTTITVRAGTKQATVRVRVVGEPVNSVRISPQQSVHVIRIGQTKQLSAECLNATQQVLTGRTITWNSNNPVIASVSSTGLVTGNALGQATITATCDNAVNASTIAQITPIPVSSVTITPGSLSLTQGTQGQLLVTARDSANNVLSLQGRQVIWTSNNNPVAVVSTQGVVSGVSIGTAQVEVSVDGVVSAPITVDVHAFFSAAPGLPPAMPTATSRLATDPSLDPRPSTLDPR